MSTASKYPNDFGKMPHFNKALAILKPIAERVYELLEQAAPNLDDDGRRESFNQSVHAAMKVLHRKVDVDTVVAKSDLPAIADSLTLLVDGFKRCRPFWKGATRSDWPDELPPVELMNSMGVLLLISEQMYPAQNGGELYFEVVELDDLVPPDE